MIYRAQPSPRVVRQIAELLPEVRGSLIETLAVVVEDPYDPVTTEPTPDPQIREAYFGDVGIARFLILDELEVVYVIDLLWAG